jgi:hypothetical protein
MEANRLLQKLATLLALTTCVSCGADEYRNRNGEAEALADMRRGAKLKIYYYVSNGAAVGSEVPGLSNCSREKANTKDKFERFVMIREAAFQEGEARTFTQNRHASSAIRFAKAYNVTTLRLRTHEVERLCPGVRAR